MLVVSYHVVIVTQARTVNALFKKLLYSAYRPLLIDWPLFPAFGGIERYPGFKLYRPVLQVFILETYLTTLPNFLSLVKKTILYY